MALNESLGFPLSVKSLNSLGVMGGFQSYDEGKKKKMDIGDEVPADDEEEPDADADDEDGEEEDKGKKLPPWLKKKDTGHSEPDGDEGCSCKGGQHTEFCKKNMKKKASKKMKAEMFSGYEDCNFKPFPEVGSDEYRDSFFKSIEGHMGAPNTRHWSGVDLEEEVLFQPQDDQIPQPQGGPGQPGFAPVGRVGGDLGNSSEEKPAWESQWKTVSDEMQGLIDQWDSFNSKLG